MKEIYKHVSSKLVRLCITISSLASSAEEVESGGLLNSEGFGYVMVMDNVDMNVRRSFQRCDHTTVSYHFCDVYGLLNRIDSSSLSDGPPSGDLSSDMALPNSSDLKRIMGNFAMLVSRYNK